MEAQHVFDRRPRFSTLRAEYENAFRQMAEETRVLQQLEAQPDADQSAIEHVSRELEQYTLVYRTSRNRLVDFLFDAAA